jgi:transposase
MSRVKKNQSTAKQRRSRKVYTQEFRDEAVRLSVTSGKSVAEIARDLDIAADTLHSWRRAAHYEHRMPVPDDETAEQKLKRLQKENELLRQERDILKKAIAYFAQPPQK